MNSMLVLCVGLISLVGALCTLIYIEQSSASRSSKKRQEQLNRLEQRFHELFEVQKKIQNRIDQLSTDVLQREIYQSASDRHKLAVKDAREGRGLGELMKKHGLSSDEAALILALHAKDPSLTPEKVKNANIGVLNSLDLS